MADIDNEKSGYVESFSKVEEPGAGSGETVAMVDMVVMEQKGSPTNSVPNVHSTATPNISSGATSSVTSHPKKFSSVNINKKFLEKNSATPSASQPNSSFSTVKSGTSNAKPVLQPATSHSRLVTTKLSTILQTSSLTGPGWSRPSSVTPVASTSNSPPVPAGSTPPAVNSVSSHAAPQLPHVGKVIQPQPRGSTIPPGGSSNGPDRPVWGRPRSTGNVFNTGVQNDFPTAAEVAQVRSAKMVEKQEAAQSAAAQKQALRAEADTFRGVHLDPNAHHWDEMEEDDDNFLGEVIDFGDGRQYTVQPVESQPSQQDAEPDQSQSENSKPPDSPSGLPVRKEDRFADDFDRSWPRSHQRSSVSHREQPLHAPSASPQVLFNERSNRLEPYSGRQNAHPPARRGSRSDLPSPIELRGGKDIPSHSQSQNVQLLQKSEGTAQRSRKYGGPEHPTLDMDGPREKTSWRETTSPSSPMHSGRPPSQMSQQDQSRQWSRDFSGDTGRRGSFSSAHSRDGGRQVSLHMSQMPLPTSPSVAGSAFRSPLLSRDVKLPAVSSGVPVSPSLSARSLASSITNPSNTSSPLVIDEETRQAAMHNAAERARIRRQQEEQNREEQKERARKKAAELEAKLEAQKAAKAGEEQKTQEQEQERANADELETKPEAARATTTLERKDSETEETTKIVESLSRPVADTVEMLPTKPVWGRSPSSSGTSKEPLVPSRPPATRRKSSNVVYKDPSPAVQTDSWRSKAAPLPSSPRSPKLEPTHLEPPPPTLVTQVDTLTVEEGEDIEVIDFSEFGKFVGAPDPPIEQPERSPALEKSELEDLWRRDPPILSRSDDASWRRGSMENHASLQDNTKVSPIDLTKKGDDDVSTSVPSRLKINSVDHSNVASHFNTQRSPRANAFREASMSALDDAMSRIKGALDHMHEIPKEIQKEARNDDVKEMPTATLPAILPIAPPIQSVQPALKPEIQRPSKWLPPALRPRDLVSNPFGLEREDPTTIRPPQSPKPAWNNFNVRLPKESIARGQMSKRQIKFAKSTFNQFRWDILSWSPPVEGMNKKDLSLNDVLFRRPINYKGKPQIRVALPGKAQRSKSESLEPKVNIPNRAPMLKVPITGAFGRPRGAGELTSWRRSEPEKQSTEVDAVLDTVSCSPPPVPSSELAAAVAPSADVQLASSESIPRSRSQPKMPAGSDVGFYRPPQEEKATIAVTGPVSFTVSSELDDRLDPSRPKGVVSNTSYSESPLESESSSAPGLVQSKADSKNFDVLENCTITPPPQSTNTAWTKSSLTYPIKESTVRGPDPEHLKIVWSKSENKDELPSINSLEGIADDFTNVPFTIQDVKSEDGATPPPIAPSRMSLSEVTRAFQQVPSRPDSTHPRSSHLSSPAPVSNNRQSNYGLPPQASQPTARPTYGPYHSPVMNNSPVPVMYAQGLAPSPVPGRMMVNGHSPHYGQQLWMPVPAGPAGQSPGPMMRPLHSPFPAQVMSSYPPPGSPMYGPPMTNGHNHMHSHQPNGTSQGRGRGAPMMSPMLSPVNPTPPYPNGRYPGSPVIMAPPSGMQGYPPPPSGPMPSGGRGQMQNGFDNMSMLPSPIGPPQPPTYAPMSSYVRPAW